MPQETMSDKTHRKLLLDFFWFNARPAGAVDNIMVKCVVRYRGFSLQDEMIDKNVTRPGCTGIKMKRMLAGRALYY